MPLVNRLNAAIGLLNSNMFWVDPVTFGLVCRTLNRNPYVASEAPDLYDISWGVTEANLIMGSPDEDDQKNGDLMYSEAVKRYIQHLLRIDRSEEHTSELQSRGHLVCRLLLEKKKKKKKKKPRTVDKAPTSDM